MSNRRGSGRRRDEDGGYEPLVAVITDSLNAGYQGLDYVLEALRASIERQPRAGSTRRGGALRTAAEGGGTRGAANPHPGDSEAAGPADVVSDLLAIFATIVERAADAAKELAQAISKQTAKSGGHTRLLAEAEPGEKAKVAFQVWNPSSSALTKVRLVASELIGEEGVGRIGADAVTSTPAVIDRIDPYRDAKASVVVSVPSSAKPGEYRGLIHSDPGDAWAILHLTVEQVAATARKSSRKRAPVKKLTPAKRKAMRARARKAKKVPTRIGPRARARKGTKAPARKATTATAKKATRKRATKTAGRGTRAGSRTTRTRSR
jgi:hypothetical protein